MTPGLPTFETDAYRRTLEAEVLASGEDDHGPFVVLSDTVLYPEGGGQPDDAGTLGGIPVSALARGEDGFRHYLQVPGRGSLPTGRVTVNVDWPRRFDHMQQHSAQHLLTALAHTHFGLTTTSFHLGEQECAIELDGPPLSNDELGRLEAMACDATREARAIAASWIPLDEYEARDDIRTRGLPDHHSGDVRLVAIDGIDITACGGTHVSNTAEIESLSLLGTEAKRGGTRLHWIAGRRIRTRLATHEKRTGALRAILGVANHELVGAVEQRMDQLKEAQKRVRSLDEELAAALVPSLLATGDSVVSVHFEGKDGGFVRTLAGHFANQATHEIAFITADANGDAFFALSVGSKVGISLDRLGSKVAGILDGRGGGRGQTFQGKAGSLDRRETALEQVRGSVTG